MNDQDLPLVSLVDLQSTAQITHIQNADRHCVLQKEELEILLVEKLATMHVVVGTLLNYLHRPLSCTNYL